jgi:hypothetical protein
MDDLLLTATGLAWVGDADAHHHLGLTDIDRGDPFDNLLDVFDALHAGAPPPPRSPRVNARRERPVRAEMIKATLIHVLAAH